MMQASLSPTHINSILAAINWLKLGQSLTVTAAESDGSCIQSDTFWHSA